MKRLRRAALVLAAIPLLAALRYTTPSYAVLTGPIVQPASLGAPVEARTFGAKLGEVRFARRLRAKLPGRTVERDTSGVWAVVPTELWATRETVTVDGAAWRGPSGRRYGLSERLGGAKPLALGKVLQPGLKRSGLMVFEIPEDEAAGARLLLSDGIDPRLDSELAFALPERFDPAKIVDVLDLDDGDLWGG